MFEIRLASCYGMVPAADVTDDSGMLVSVDGRAAAVRGVSVETLAAAACFVSVVGLIALAGAGTSTPPITTLMWGWPVCTVVGGVLLDVRPGDRTGRGLVALGAMPVVMLGWAMLRSGGRPLSTAVVGYSWEIAAPITCAVGIGIAVAALPSARSPARRMIPAASLLAALVAVGATARHSAAVMSVAWLGVGIGIVACWTLVLVEAMRRGRTERRRVTACLLQWRSPARSSPRRR
jgi:hypothetical protein